MTDPKIPVRNAYFMFCYAWDLFEEAQGVPLGADVSPDLANLLGRVLVSGTRRILRRGLDRGYQLHDEEIATVRGHIELGATLKLQARNLRRLHCEFDDLSHDVPHNRVIKASLKRLAKTGHIERALAHEMRALVQRMPDVSDIHLTRGSFSRVQLHRNNAHYALLMKVAELAFDCLLPDPERGGYAFQDVLRDERKMARVFEAFVRNFYRTEQRTFAVDPLQIEWDAQQIHEGGRGKLPRMVVDVFLRSLDRKIIIDTKYYAEALQTRHDAETFRSTNLYQLFSYLKNQAGRDPSFESAEGILLYPEVGYTLDTSYQIQGHRVTIASVNLGDEWADISARLHQLIS